MRRLCSFVVLSFIVVMLCGYKVSAETEKSTAGYSEAVYTQMQVGYGGSKYSTSGGGYYGVDDLLCLCEEYGDIYVVTEEHFTQLTTSAKDEFLTDLTAAAGVVADDWKSLNNQVEWYNILLTQESVASPLSGIIHGEKNQDFETPSYIEIKIEDPLQDKEYSEEEVNALLDLMKIQYGFSDKELYEYLKENLNTLKVNGYGANVNMSLVNLLEKRVHDTETQERARVLVLVLMPVIVVVCVVIALVQYKRWKRENEM